MIVVFTSENSLECEKLCGVVIKAINDVVEEMQDLTNEFIAYLKRKGITTVNSVIDFHKEYIRPEMEYARVNLGSKNAIMDCIRMGNCALAMKEHVN
jgi:hypothetical protein